jgi:Ras-related protein Rab-7A
MSFQVIFSGVPYYRGADCCILVFDCTNRDSFQSIESWRNEFLLHANPGPLAPYILIANKIDREHERQVTAEEARKWVESKGNTIYYFEASAKDGTNVNAAFVKIGEDCLKLVRFRGF